MAKRKLRSSDDVQETTLPAPSPEAELREVPRLSLARIRNDHLKLRTETAHTIADLEAWASEIQATIAFLKGKE